MITGNEPAAPFRGLDGCLIAKDDTSHSIENGEVYSGLTIRQELAARFYAARIGGLTFASERYLPSMVAELSCRDADALIAELNYTTSKTPEA